MAWLGKSACINPTSIIDCDYVIDTVDIEEKNVKNVSNTCVDFNF